MKDTMMKVGFVCVLVGLLAGCSTMGLPGKLVGDDGYNPQNYQGCIRVHVTATGTSPDVHVMDCKDRQNLTALVDLQKGTLNLTESGINGSTAAALRSQVENTFANVGGDVAKTLGPALMNVFMTAMGFPGNALPSTQPTTSTAPANVVKVPTP